MKSIKERQNHIQKAVQVIESKRKAGENIRTYSVKGWKEDHIVLPTVRLHTDYLLFRIENTRTFRQQLGYLTDNPNLPNNFFSDPESTDVQKAQEEILLNMISQSSSGNNFLEDLSTRGQEDPAIITSEGYIVNGNRRTAALKKLGYEFVICVVLPEDATKKDLYALEHLLQISEDFKEDYHWVNELNNFYQGIHNQSLGFNKEQMIKRFRISNVELDAKLRTMDLVNQFLSWNGVPRKYDYEKLDFAEEIFRQLEKATKNITDEKNRQELMNAVFHLIEEPPAQGRLYSHVTSLIRNWETVYKRIYDESVVNQEESGTLENNLNPINKTIGDLFDVLVDKNENRNKSIFSNPINVQEMSKKIFETVEDVKAEKKERNAVEAVYEGVSAALRDLQGLYVDKNSTKLVDSKNKLKQIIKVSEELLIRISSLS